MKNVIFALTAFLFFIFTSTPTFAQAKVKKGKVKTQKGVLQPQSNPKSTGWIRDSMFNQTKGRPGQLRTNSNQGAQKSGSLEAMKQPKQNWGTRDSLPWLKPKNAEPTKMRSRNGNVQGSKRAKPNNPNLKAKPNLERKKKQVKKKNN
jgi:hypothetical protein